MAVAGNADPMLGYLTTSFREHPELRRRVGKGVTTAMEQRLGALGTDVATLYARYWKAGNRGAGLYAPPQRNDTWTTLEEEGRRTLAQLRERGFDLGHRADAAATETRLQAIYENARLALYAEIDHGVLRGASPRHLQVQTEAGTRDDYLAHPATGERIRPDDVAAVTAMYPSRRPDVQIVVSDGLNANAVNEHLRALLLPVRRILADSGCDVGDVDIVLLNGRVRAGYHLGQLLDVRVVVHILGERPGTGLNTVSAYLTYGRDDRGLSRWTPALDHSCTTAVCGIHPKGKTPVVAAAEIARLVVRMLEQRRSGVGLGGRS
jgi:ethanolamine ammonia-lyase large subunit